MCRDRARLTAPTKKRRASLCGVLCSLSLLEVVLVVAAIQTPPSRAPLAFVKTSLLFPATEIGCKENNTNNKSNIMNRESAAVLSELKDTIKSQKAEIDKLRKELNLASSTTTKKAVSSGGHIHGHGHSSSAAGKEDILDYKMKTAVSIAYERVWWLAIFLLSLSFTAVIMNGFEHTLSKQIELAYFVPLMAGHGGNTGGQAVGTVLSGLSAGVISKNDALRVVSKEAMSGMIMGIILGGLVGPISHYAMGISVHVATVVSVTFPLLSTIAALLGSSLPFACVMLGLDPAVIAAPAMTSFVDVSGLLCYFLIANKIFQMFGMDL